MNVWWLGYVAGLMGGIAIGVGAFTLLKDWIDHKRRQEEWDRRQAWQRHVDMMLASLGPPQRRPRPKLTVIQGDKDE